MNPPCSALEDKATSRPVLGNDFALHLLLCGHQSISWALCMCMLGFVAVWPSVCYVGLCGCIYGRQSDMLGFVAVYMAVSLICWALWLCGRQSDMLGFVAVYMAVSLICWALWAVYMAVSLICWALWLCGRQSDMLGIPLV